MRRKSGFTLVELLATIVVLSVIILAATPAVLSIAKKIRTSMYCTKVEMVKKAGQMYGQENILNERCIINNNAYDCQKITVNDLITKKFITPDKNNTILTDPRDKSSMNNISLTLYKKYNKLYAIVDAIGCGDITSVSTGYDILLALNGGTLSESFPIALKAGDTISLPTPIKTDYTFTGWTVTGTGSSITNNILTIGTEELTLTASWILSTRTLTVNANGGTWNGTTPQSIVIGHTVTINDPVKSGYAFTGWTITGTDSSINGTTFTMGTTNTIITANWMTTTPTIFAYTGAVQTFTPTLTGYYKIELWGAQSGNTGTSYGGYTSGYLYMTQGTTYYIYVGGQGNGGCVTGTGGGYNGGGNSGTSGCSRGGGGATDIRLVGGSWNDTTGLNSRIMVAGGGGSGENNIGGAGGGLMGGPNNAGGYATQISGSAFGYAATPGFDSSGAGGGYYGGALATADGVAAGGGSSFISGFAGSNAITSASSTVATNNTKHYSNNYFLNNTMASGINTGNGKAQIAFSSLTAPTRTNTTLNNVRYIKDCVNGITTGGTGNEWVELQAIYQGSNVAKGKTVTGSVAQNASYPYTRITDGDIATANYAAAGTAGLQCITVDLGQTYNLDEVAVWHYWGDSRTYIDNITYVSSDNSNWSGVITSTVAESSQGKRASAFEVLKIKTNINFNNTRYVRDCIDGSNVYNGDHWVELKVIKDGVNIAYGKTVTGTTAAPTDRPYSWAVNNDITSANWTGAGATGLQCITVDLAQQYNVDFIKVWHYYDDSRIYYRNMAYTSSDGTTWRVILANQSAETSLGKVVSAWDAILTKLTTVLNNVRYVKDCINGSNANTGNHWVELKIIKDGINLAKGKTATGTTAISNPAYLTDDDVTTANYSSQSGGALQCVTIDLGQIYNLDEVAVWHYFADSRIYYNNITYVSSDNNTWVEALNTGNQAETGLGKKISAWR